MKDYKDQIKINEFDIDNEIIKQPQLYYEASKLAALAKNQKEDAKDDYDIVRLKIEAKLRKNKDQYGTEGAIKTAVDNHPKVKRYRKRFMEARAKSNLLEKHEKAFEERRRMIETYVYWKTHNMNSNVKVPRQYEMEMNQQVSSDIKDQLRSSIVKRRKKRK